MHISIALATFNGEKHIMEQLESFSAQTVLPDELVICDDCSTDKTIDLVSHFATTAPFKVTLIENEKNLGHVQNFSKALSFCSGDVVFLSDQDDKWFPRKIEKIRSAFQENPNLWIVVHDGELTDGKLSPSGQTKMSQIRRGYGSIVNISTGALSAVRKDLLKYCLPIPPSIKAHDSWIHLVASLLPARRLVLKQTLQYIRRHESNTSSWVVNRGTKINRFDVIRAHANSEPAHDYTDRLAINTGLKDVIGQMLNELIDPSDLYAARNIEARLASEHKAIKLRQALVRFPSFKRKLYSTYMLLSGKYMHFNGIRSFIRDIIR
ncbi:glycosyltransferase [Ponticoccus sp. SC2-23]|uniref:glycosyltransferase n=1 Tax=Alexandriicola marinus TaxID=2081710 RepID=UPI0013DF33FF|nr:glycosyltransferase [Alexandriicola marinus]MBM1222836.1 glycosyltransferase [Ponticoccus sp. SC6-9]MBM1227218.1 glycosyltransferase [Ponticoccus sp. SC6-15]MBM1231762.1 glycosyltransferase [Ponticoccus sp. SC6-38]MBM1236335.1 glycosyltransferase [Ponticoccus sp. SC6-45]MBM1240785.1 glycosyltransferase [Ponticoccus sp. SC6-49]MBM1245320.1 glycosyltransferase [Ponticoccus sp. SC2-64]MBM1249808.1 glycosyltransferase [Ponticoccus sp. SC6-42]MBM1254278.1 glycosyltransferase [Ponticoccus sp. 